MSRALDVLIPHGGLNGSLDMCVSHLLNQTLLPHRIHVLVDSNAPLMPSPWLIRMARARGVELCVVWDTNTSSIIDMRLKLIRMATEDLAVFVDDDMILHHQALELLEYTFSQSFNVNDPIPFVEGHRIEVGGRKDEFFATHERKLGSEAQTQTRWSNQEFGDTALLLMNIPMFTDINTDKLLEFYDGRNIGGSDFALTSLVAQKHGPGRSCPGAYGWHTASEQKGYWKNYATADRVYDLVFKKGGPYADKS